MEPGRDAKLFLVSGKGEFECGPCQWIWFPSERTLPNTFVLFRREVWLDRLPQEVSGWIYADSRYRLTLNGRRVQWGPAPCDPRHIELDPIQMREGWRIGKNVVGVEVLYYGHGEGTWPFGKPGLLVDLVIDGRSVVSDESWQCIVDRAHRPGQPKRWYLRALQEEFDARLHPEAWDTPEFDPGPHWASAAIIGRDSLRPPIATGYPEYLQEATLVPSAESSVGKRSVPMLEEHDVKDPTQHPGLIVAWEHPPDDWFQFRRPDCYRLHPLPTWQDTKPPAAGWGMGRLLTFEFEEGLVGWSWFEVEAPEGTVIEMMVHENHDPNVDPWLDTSFFAWSRFICRQGRNRFEPFDFEAFKWVELHIWNDDAKAIVKRVGARRRTNPSLARAHFKVGDERLQKVFEACLNTMKNSAQDTIVDGMARERQQYAGDGSHQLVPLRLSCGDYSLPNRFLKTFALGQLGCGVWLDSWPGYDRLARLWEREMDVSSWGPLVDHSVGFCLDHYYHWMESGDLTIAESNWPSLLKFVEYLRTIRDRHGLLKVDGLGVNAVWIDHDAYRAQRDKQCAFNLYAAAMLNDGLARLAAEIEPTQTANLQDLASDLLDATLTRFYDFEQDLFIINRPWRDEDHEERLCDRSLATGILFDQIPLEDEAGRVLAERPANLGISYPANALWRFQALAKVGRIQTVLDELRGEWFEMRSVKTNNTIQELWNPKPNTAAILSHCAVAPLTSLYRDIVGIRPIAPGYRQITVNPQLGDVQNLDVDIWTPQGPIQFRCRAGNWNLDLPPGVELMQGDWI